MVCVRFGMVTMDTDVDELCSLLLELGAQIEESSRFLETMSEMLMKGESSKCMSEMFNCTCDPR